MNRKIFSLVIGLGVILLSVGVWVGLSNQDSLESKDGQPGQENERQELLVFAAASLTDAFHELAVEFEKEHKKVQVQLNLASSGSLQIQIEQGAPADLFASASTRQMDALLEKNLMVQDNLKIFARNRLVIVGRKDLSVQIQKLTDLQDEWIKEIGMGNPKTVPAGQYTALALQELQLWDGLEGKLIYGNHVRQVLQYVVQREVDLGFVYQTDLYHQQEVTKLYTVPELTHPPIQYPIGIVKESKRRELAQEFIQLVLSPTGQGILERYGFEVGE